MDDARLPTELWLKAQLRRLNGAGTPAMVLKRGDSSGGLVLVKVNSLGAGVRVFTQTRDQDGAMAWIAGLGGRSVPDAEADAYAERSRYRDPDLWIIEVEDRSGALPFEGKVL